jgi:hypothetical protein
MSASSTPPPSVSTANEALCGHVSALTVPPFPCGADVGSCPQGCPSRSEHFEPFLGKVLGEGAHVAADIDSEDQLPGYKVSDYIDAPLPSLIPPSSQAPSTCSATGIGYRPETQPGMHTIFASQHGSQVPHTVSPMTPVTGRKSAWAATLLETQLGIDTLFAAQQQESQVSCTVSQVTAAMGISPVDPLEALPSRARSRSRSPLGMLPADGRHSCPMPVYKVSDYIDAPLPSLTPPSPVSDAEPTDTHISPI